MATEHISIEKRAKGKSNLFKFVTLRNPETVSPEDDERRFVYHPNPTDSIFIEDGADLTVNSSKESLKAIADGFNPLTSVEDIKKINPDLALFADWLFRNKNVIDIETINDKVTATILTNSKLKKV